MPVCRATAPTDRCALLDHLVSDPVSWGRQVRVDTLGDIEALRGWLDTREAAILDVSFSECDDVNSAARDITQLCQQASNVSYGVAKRRAERAMWLPRLPAATAALAAGHLGSAQADELCALAERLGVEQRDSLYLAENDLVAELIALTPVQARKRLLSFETDLTPENADDRLERQQKANRLRLTKNSDGTSSLFGQLDPLSAAYLRTALDHKVTELWRLETRNRQGEDPPSQVMTDQTRRARALVELVRAGHAAGAGARGHAEILVLIDYKTLMGDLTAAGICNLGDQTPIPPSTARRLACEANIIPIVFGGPSASLDVGRGSRTATPAQKTAARAIHDTCAVKNCDVAFEHCQLHHIKWWRNGGRTDLDNLTPLCSKHHHLVHDHSWQLLLDANRVATLHRPPVAPASRESTARPLPQDAMVPMRC